MRRVPVVVIMAMLLSSTSSSAMASVAAKPVTAAAGSFVDLELTVANERANADLQQVSVAFLSNQRPSSASAPQHRGWSASIDSSSGAVSTITWSGRMAPGAVESFVVALRLPNDVPKLSLPTVLRYSDGTTERTVGEGTVAAPEAAGVAPSIELTGAITTTTTSAPTTTSSVITTATDESSSDGDDGPGPGMVLIVFGLVLAIFISRRAWKKR